MVFGVFQPGIGVSYAIAVTSSPLFQM